MRPILLFECLWFLLVAIGAHAQTPFGQVLVLDAKLKAIYGAPQWLLIVRNINSGQVLPYLYDFRGANEHWLAFTYGRSYQITVSELSFGPDLKIHNFCGLEGRGGNDVSLVVNIEGILAPDFSQARCIVRPYRDMPFTIVDEGP